MSGLGRVWAGRVADYCLQLCGDGPSAADFKSQAAWAGGVGKWEGAEDTVVGLVAAVSLSPLRILSRA